MALLPIIARFASRVVQRAGACPEACAAILALNDYAELLQVVPLGLVTADQLRFAVTRFLRACQAAEWTESMTPKFHWQIHMPSHLEKFGYTPTCWVHERKHRLVKRFADDVRDMKHFARIVLRQVVVHQIIEATDPTAFDSSVRVLHAVRASKAFCESMKSHFNAGPDFEVLVGRKARVSPWSTVRQSDMVMMRVSGNPAAAYVAAEVIKFIKLPHMNLEVAQVMLCRFASRDPDGKAAVWNQSGEEALVQLHHLICSVAYCVIGKGALRIFVPFQFRGVEPEVKPLA